MFSEVDRAQRVSICRIILFGVAGEHENLKLLGALQHEFVQPAHARCVALHELVVQDHGAAQLLRDGETQHGRNLVSGPDRQPRELPFTAGGLDVLSRQRRRDRHLAVRSAGQFGDSSRYGFDERLPEVHGTFGLGIPKRFEQQLPGTIFDFDLALASLDRLHGLVRLFELLLDGMTTNLLQRAFRFLQLRVPGVALFGQEPNGFHCLLAVPFGDFHLRYGQCRELGAQSLEVCVCRCGIFALRQSGALINSTRQPVACLPRRFDRLSTLGAARLGDRKPLRALPGDGSGLFDLVAGPGLQRFELRLQVPVISSQGLEFGFRMCQSRLPGIVERLPFFLERGFLLIQLLLPGLDASLGPGDVPLEVGDPFRSPITISTNGLEFLFQRGRVGSVAGRALPNELLKVPFAKLGIKLSFEPLQLPPALGDACRITSKSRCLTRFLLGFTSQISGLGKASSRRPGTSR